MVIGFGGRIAAGMSMVLAAVPVLGVTAGRSASAPGTPAAEVIVQASSPAALAGAVSAAGGHVVTPMPALGLAAVAVPVAAESRLSAQPGVESVTADRAMRVASAGDGSSGTGLSLTGTPSVYRAEVGADALAARGDTGAGAVVALIDTGVTPVPDLAGRLVTGLQNPSDPSGPPVDCINFSGDRTCRDGFGHGTFEAGLIAGTGADSNGRFTGVAPGARIINIKVARADGSTDLVRVLAAFDWAISFKQQYGISVLNVALGAEPTRDPAHDPLDVAAEAAWKAGIAVVAAAGNAGPAPGTITAPGDDPMVITVGATNDQGTAGPADDTVAPFSSEGPTRAGVAKPDVVAPGTHIVGLQAPGSVVSAIPTEADLTAPNFDGAYRRGSGTSMATAITSGVAALVWSDWAARPGFSAAAWPGRLKAALTSTAASISSSDPAAEGAGLVDAAAAVNSSAALAAPVPVPASRASAPTPASWYAGPFAGQNWEGQNWEGQNWEGQNWEGQNWEGSFG